MVIRILGAILGFLLMVLSVIGLFTLDEPAIDYPDETDPIIRWDDEDEVLPDTIWDALGEDFVTFAQEYEQNRPVNAIYVQEYEEMMYYEVSDSSIIDALFYAIDDLELTGTSDMFATDFSDIVGFEMADGEEYFIEFNMEQLLGTDNVYTLADFSDLRNILDATILVSNADTFANGIAAFGASEEHTSPDFIAGIGAGYVEDTAPGFTAGIGADSMEDTMPGVIAGVGIVNKDSAVAEPMAGDGSDYLEAAMQELMEGIGSDYIAEDIEPALIAGITMEVPEYEAEMEEAEAFADGPDDTDVPFITFGDGYSMQIPEGLILADGGEADDYKIVGFSEEAGPAFTIRCITPDPALTFEELQSLCEDLYGGSELHDEGELVYLTAFDESNQSDLCLFLSGSSDEIYIIGMTGTSAQQPAQSYFETLK